MTGTLYGLGVGPGDPELLTLKAVRILKQVRVVSYITPLEKDGPGPSMARSIASSHLARDIVEISVPIAMREDPKPGQVAYDEAAEKISGLLDEGQDVAFLCEGDPLLYGSFMYLLERLSSIYRVITVPGVSSLGGAAAAANLPLVSRHESLAVLPATLSIEELEARLQKAEAAAIFKVGRHLEKIRTVLRGLGCENDAWLVIRASHEDQHVMKLMEAPDRAPYFSMVLVPAQKGVVN